MDIYLFIYLFFFFNSEEKLENFDSNTDIGIFLGYSCKVYRVLNKRTLSTNDGVFDESCNNIYNESIYSDDLEKTC